MHEMVARQLLRQSRRRAGLTQVELAQRAGVAQSVISAYESGRRQPTLPTLLNLIDAAGQEVVTELRPRPARPRLEGPIGMVVEQRRHELIGVAAAHGVENLRLFGSVARGEERADSDVDLLADLPPDLGILGYGRLIEALESVLDGVSVDLVPAVDLKPDVRARVEAESVPL